MNYVKLHDFLFDMNYNLHKLLSYEIMYNYNLKQSGAIYEFLGFLKCIELNNDFSIYGIHDFCFVPIWISRNYLDIYSFLY